MAVVIDQEYILIWILEMFETPPEGPAVVATHYSPSHCLVMFASETPAANKYLNRLLVIGSTEPLRLLDPFLSGPREGLGSKSEQICPDQQVALAYI